MPPCSIQSMEFSRPGYWSGLPCPPPGNLPNPGIEARSPTLQADSLPAELPGKPKNTGVGSLSLLQRIFLTQESNQGLLHCRQILYQLSYLPRTYVKHCARVRDVVVNKDRTSITPAECICCSYTMFRMRRLVKIIS